MKKIVLLLVTMIFVCSAMAQTFKSVKAENKAEQKSIQEKLEIVKERLFYLEVTLPSKPVTTNEKENAKLKQDKYYAADEIAELKIKKEKLEALIDELEESSLEIDRLRISKGSPKNFPEKMGPVEYKRRNRTQAYQILDMSEAVTNEKGELKGLLTNNKRGLSQIAVFYFVRTDIKEPPRVGIPVEPQSEVVVYLPMGTYQCTVVCGNQKKVGLTPVDPRSTATVGKYKQTVHFWATQNL